MHHAAVLRYRLHGFTKMQRRTAALGEIELRGNAGLRTDIAHALLVITRLIVAHIELRETPANRFRIENLVRNSKASRGSRRVFEKIRDMRFSKPGVARNDQSAGNGQQIVTRRRLDFTPDFVRALDQRDVLLAFADREPGYP